MHPINLKSEDIIEIKNFNIKNGCICYDFNYKNHNHLEIRILGKKSLAIVIGNEKIKGEIIYFSHYLKLFVKNQLCYFTYSKNMNINFKKIM